MFQYIESANRTVPIHNHGVTDFIKNPENQDMSAELIRKGDFVIIPGRVCGPTSRGVFHFILYPFPRPESRKYMTWLNTLSLTGIDRNDLVVTLAIVSLGQCDDFHTIRYRVHRMGEQLRVIDKIVNG